MKVYWINICCTILLTYILVTYFIPEDLNALKTIALLFSAYCLLWILSYFYSKSYFRTVPKIFSLFFYFIRELIVASLKIAYDILTPKFLLRPGVIALPLTAATDLEITILANMISLTPGTLSLAVSEDRKILYVHILYMDDPESEKNNIIKGFERRLLEITRQ